MSKRDTSSDVFADMNAIVAQSIEQARGAMNNYLQFLQNGMSATPWAGTEYSKKMMEYAERNVAAAFDFAQKISTVKTFEDAVRVQTEFVHQQMQTLSEQAKDLAAATTRAATESFKGPFSSSS